MAKFGNKAQCTSLNIVKAYFIFTLRSQIGVFTSVVFLYSSVSKGQQGETI